MKASATALYQPYAVLLVVRQNAPPPRAESARDPSHANTWSSEVNRPRRPVSVPLQKATSRLTSFQAGESLSVEPLMTDRRCSRPCPALFASQDVQRVKGGFIGIHTCCIHYRPSISSAQTPLRMHYGTQRRWSRRRWWALTTAWRRRWWTHTRSIG